MTEKQSKAIKLVGKGMSKRQAMLKAGYSPSVANNPSKLTKSKSVQQQLQKALKKHRITVDRIVKPIDDALGATRIAVDKQSGELYDTGIADHSIRLKGSQMAQRLIGLDSDKNMPENNQYNDKTILEALQNTDKLELYKAVFNKDSEQSETVIKD